MPCGEEIGNDVQEKPNVSMKRGAGKNLLAFQRNLPPVPTGFHSGNGSSKFV